MWRVLKFERSTRGTVFPAFLRQKPGNLLTATQCDSDFGDWTLAPVHSVSVVRSLKFQVVVHLKVKSNPMFCQAELAEKYQ